MDALSLLCTLHADGPATRKRLQNAGCASLSALLERPLSEVAAALDVAPAAARRLLREARLLAERVGPDLEAEDGPAPVPATAGPEPFSFELPPATATATLDQGDRALLERIVRDGPPARPAADPMPALTKQMDAELASVAAWAAEATLPGLAPAPTALERAGIDLSEEGPWPTSTREIAAASVAFGHVEQVISKAPSGAFAQAEWTPGAASEPEATPSDSERAEGRPVEPQPVEEPLAGALADPAPLLALEGVDGALASALARAGVHTTEQLARADALHLARELRVTVAQAKRLSFLARRATLAQPAPSKSPAPAARCLSPQRAAWRIEPQSQPLAPAPEHPAAPPVVRVAARVVGPVSAPLAARLDATPTATPSASPAALPVGPRPRFWEPRSGASADAPPGAHEPQGVPVDPAEVDRPRRFTDVRRSAAPQQAAGHAEPRPSAAAPAAPSDPDSGAALPTVGTILDWNFEIPRAAPSPAPERERRTWRPLEVDESSAGPFA